MSCWRCKPEMKGVACGGRVPGAGGHPGAETDGAEEGVAPRPTGAPGGRHGPPVPGGALRAGHPAAAAAPGISAAAGARRPGGRPWRGCSAIRCRPALGRCTFPPIGSCPASPHQRLSRKAALPSPAPWSTTQLKTPSLGLAHVHLTHSINVMDRQEVMKDPMYITGPMYLVWYLRVIRAAGVARRCLVGSGGGGSGGAAGAAGGAAAAGAAAAAGELGDGGHGGGGHLPHRRPAGRSRHRLGRPRRPPEAARQVVRRRRHLSPVRHRRAGERGLLPSGPISVSRPAPVRGCFCRCCLCSYHICLVYIGTGLKCLQYTQYGPSTRVHLSLPFSCCVLHACVP